MMRSAMLIVVALGSVSLPAQAQNRDLRVLSPPSASVAFEPDEFSWYDIGAVPLGRFQTYYYAGFELTLRAVVPKSGGTVLYTISVLAPRLRSPGRITQVSYRGGGPLTEIGQTGGSVRCGGASCRNDAAGDYELPDEVLGILRSGQAVDIRVSTTCGTECDVVQPIRPDSFVALDSWVASRQGQPSPVTPTE